MKPKPKPKPAVKKLKPSERIKQIAQLRYRPGYNQPQVSISDVVRYLDEVAK